MATPLPRRAAALGVACLLGALAPACEMTLPGQVLGTYQVTATGELDTCGLGAPSAYQFDVELSEAGGTLYWSWLDNAPIASGTLTPASSTSSRASLSSTQSEDVDPTDAGPGPCTMQRSDSLVVTLVKESPPSTFTGTMSYVFAAEPGADCADQLASAGGMYSELPCTVTYTIAGTLQ